MDLQTGLNLTVQCLPVLRAAGTAKVVTSGSVFKMFICKGVSVMTGNSAAELGFGCSFFPWKSSCTAHSCLQLSIIVIDQVPKCPKRMAGEADSFLKTMFRDTQKECYLVISF